MNHVPYITKVMHQIIENLNYGWLYLFNMSLYQKYKSLMHRNDRDSKIANKCIFTMGHFGQALHYFHHGQHTNQSQDNVIVA